MVGEWDWCMKLEECALAISDLDTGIKIRKEKIEPSCEDSDGVMQTKSKVQLFQMD